MDAQQNFNGMLRTIVGAALRSEGFAGSGASWSMRGSARDWALVNFQKSSFGTAKEVVFYVNLAVVVEPERLFRAWLQGKSPVKAPKAAEGLWQARLAPLAMQDRTRLDRWDCGDGSAAETIGTDIVTTLRERAFPAFRELRQRSELLHLLDTTETREIHGGHLKYYPVELMRALMLSDAGQSLELTKTLAVIQEQTPSTPEGNWSREFLSASTWVHTRTQD